LHITADMKTLKQTFTTEKGNIIEVIGSKITGRGINDVDHTIKVNGVIQDETYNQSQLFKLMKV